MALKFRRGTTAQQSGSLAFGEPYVNTTLGTLVVGGASGDIQLANTGPNATFNGASVSASTFVSASSLKVTGNASIDGNLTLGGQLTIGDATSDTVNVVASLSSSLIPQTTNAFDLGSPNKIWRDLYISTGSIKFVADGSVISTLSANANGSQNFPSGAVVTGSFVTTGSLVEFNVEWPSAPGEQHIVKTDGFTLEGRNYEYAAIALQHYEDSPGIYHNAINTYMFDSANNFGAESLVGPFRSHIRAYPSGSGGNIANVSVQDLKNGTTQALVYADYVQIGAYHAESVIVGNSGSVVEISGSVRANITGSIAATNGVISGSSQLTSSFAGLNTANIFTGNQTITGSLFISQDLIVQGSSSIQNISSSRLDIGDNIIQLNVNNPSLRFGGLAIYDSGSAGNSGSFLYDSLHDEFIFVHKGNGTNVTSSHFVLGPETYDNLGTETYLTNNTLPKGSGREHLNDSNITDTGTLITLGSNTIVNGTLVASGTSLVSSSAQVVGILSSLNSYTASNDSTNTSQNASISNLNSTTASLLIETANLEAFSASALTRLSNLEGTDISITLTGDVTGTGTITNLANVSFATTIAANSVALGTDTTGDYVASLVQGTGVTITNNSGESATPTIAIGQSVATNATPTFGNLTINGTITATGDITAFFTSDRRHKNTIEIIPNALDKVKQLNGVTWEWNDDVNEVTKSTPKTGLIAQEVQEVLPEVVKEREDGFLSLDYSKMVGLLVEAIKEQQSTISKLESDIKQMADTVRVLEENK